MQRYWRRFVYRNDEDRFPLWLYLTLAVTLANGVAFVFFGDTTTVQASSLYHLTAIAFGTHAAALWGLAAIAAAILTVVNLLARYRPISSVGPLLGYLAWLYAVLMYASHGYVLQLVSAVAWLSLWMLHHIHLWTYRHNVDNGIESPPK